MKGVYLSLAAVLLLSATGLPAHAAGSGGAATAHPAPAAPVATGAPAGSASRPTLGSYVPTYYPTWTPAGKSGTPSRSAAPGRDEGPVAHARTPGPPPAVLYKVVMRDGSAVFAKDLPKLAANTVRFTDTRGILVSARASEVDLRATAAANHVAWPAAPAAGAAAKSQAPPAAAAKAKRPGG